ncbi:MAG: DNA methyltransferase, partial [Candidatus Poribacteria bacterium]|nr:DNA methyltransferase [Candidatus Poribacteria bacterium]
LLDEQGIYDEDMPLFQPPARETARLQTLSADQQRLLIKNSISPRPLHKTLTLLDAINKANSPQFDSHARLALAKQLVASIGNLQFGPEVGIG